MWATLFIAAMCFSNAQRFFDSILIKVIKDRVNAFAIKA